MKNLLFILATFGVIFVFVACDNLGLDTDDNEDIACSTNADCFGGQICVDNVCKQFCSKSIVCKQGYFCDPVTSTCAKGMNGDGDLDLDADSIDVVDIDVIDIDVVDIDDFDVVLENEAEADTDWFCEAGEYRCKNERYLQRCSENHDAWLFYRDCPEGTECKNALCIDITPDGDSDNETETEGEINSCEACNIDDGCVDSLKYCFPDSIDSQTGCCRQFCDQPNIKCPRGTTCKDAICQWIEGYCKSDADCLLDSFCDKLPGADDGICKKYCFHMGQSCPELYSCDYDEYSVTYGKCLLTNPACDVCQSDAECEFEEAGKYCNKQLGSEKGCCVPKCGSEHPCPGLLTCCADGRCEVNCTNGCACDCGTGYICDEYDNCSCTLNCPESCEEGYYCNARTAPYCIEYPQCKGWGALCYAHYECCPNLNCCPYGIVGMCLEYCPYL